MIAWTFVVKHDQYQDKRFFTFKEALKTIIDSIPALMMPVIIIGGIRFGIFTPTEAGAFAVVYAFIISVFVYKHLKAEHIVEVFVSASKMTAVVMFVVAAASAVAWLLTVAQIPNQVAALFSGLAAHPMILMIVINLFLLAVGMVMDLTPAILIFTPVLLPLVTMAGISPYYFGIIMVLNLCIGLITPPVGTILYLGCGIADIGFGKMVKGILPFLITELIFLAILVLIPALVMVPFGWFYPGG